MARSRRAGALITANCDNVSVEYLSYKGNVISVTISVVIEHNRIAHSWV